MKEVNYFEDLKNTSSFSMDDFVCEFKKKYPNFSDSYAKKTLQKYLYNNQIARIGRNKYIILNQQDLLLYSYKLSDKAHKLNEIVSKNFPDLTFKIFELIQLNEFFNHQIAHNIFFLFVESGLGDFVFDSLKDEYAGKLLIYPSVTDIEKYLVDDMIIIENLTSEAPNEKVKKSMIRLEQLLVDLLCDSSMRSLINVNEIPEVVNSIMNKYVIDQSKMFRYARRRNIENKLKNIIFSQGE